MPHAGRAIIDLLTDYFAAMQPRTSTASAPTTPTT